MAGFSTQDATTPTPHASPLPYTTTVIALTTPDNAVQLFLSPTTPLRVSEDPTMTRYYIVATGTEAVFDVSLTPTVYIARDSVSGTVNFRYATV